ncbi:MAG: 50S ribosomal protein L25 [Planctomycetota bacterium]
MPDPLEVAVRSEIGSRSSRKLRATGKLPAVLYGHGEDPVSLVVSFDQLRGVLRHGGKVVDLQGAVTGQALLQDTQWDTFGTSVLHIDLMRVDAGELVHVEVEVELKGEAAGQREGGMIDQTLRAVEIEAAPAAIPEKLHLDITELHLGGSMSASEIVDLPEGAKLVTDGGAMVVHCVAPAGDSDDAAVPITGAEPEVVGGKGGDAEGGD